MGLFSAIGSVTKPLSLLEFVPSIGRELSNLRGIRGTLETAKSSITSIFTKPISYQTRKPLFSKFPGKALMLPIQRALGEMKPGNITSSIVSAVSPGLGLIASEFAQSQGILQENLAEQNFLMREQLTVLDVIRETLQRSLTGLGKGFSSLVVSMASLGKMYAILQAFTLRERFIGKQTGFVERWFPPLNFIKEKMKEILGSPIAKDSLFRLLFLVNPYGALLTGTSLGYDAKNIIGKYLSVKFLPVEFNIFRSISEMLGVGTWKGGTPIFSSNSVVFKFLEKISVYFSEKINTFVTKTLVKRIAAGEKPIRGLLRRILLLSPEYRIIEGTITGNIFKVLHGSLGKRFSLIYKTIQGIMLPVTLAKSIVFNLAKLFDFLFDNAFSHIFGKIKTSFSNFLKWMSERGGFFGKIFDAIYKRLFGRKTVIGNVTERVDKIKDYMKDMVKQIKSQENIFTKVQRTLSLIKNEIVKISRFVFLITKERVGSEKTREYFRKKSIAKKTETTKYEPPKSKTYGIGKEEREEESLLGEAVKGVAISTGMYAARGIKHIPKLLKGKGFPVLVGGYFAYKSISENKDIGGKIGGVLGTVGGTVAGAKLGVTVGGAIGSLFGGPGIGTAVGGIIGGLLTAIVSYIGMAVGSWLGSRFVKIMDKATIKVIELSDKLKEFLSIERIRDILSEVFEAVSNATTGFVKDVAGAVKEAPQALSKTATGIKEGLIEFAGKIFPYSVKNLLKSAASLYREMGSKGVISQMFESGLRPGAINPYGNQAFGAYQIEGTNIPSFLKFIAKNYPEAYNRLGLEQLANLGTRSREFHQKWKEIAKREPELFRQTQWKFIEKTHYEPIKNLAQKLGFKMENPAVEEALISASVHHGGASSILRRLAQNYNIAGMLPKEQIEALIKGRMAHVAMIRKINRDEKAALYKRLRREGKATLEFLEMYERGELQKKKEGADILSQKAKMETPQKPVEGKEDESKQEEKKLYEFAKQYYEKRGATIQNNNIFINGSNISSTTNMENNVPFVQFLYKMR